MTIELFNVNKYLRFIRWYRLDMIFEKVWTLILIGVVAFFPKKDIGYLLVVFCSLISYCIIQSNMTHKYGKKIYRSDIIEHYEEFLTVCQAIYCIKDEDYLIDYLYKLPYVIISKQISGMPSTCICGQKFEYSYIFTIYLK